MDALSPRHPAQRVVFMKGSQLGASESGCCWISSSQTDFAAGDVLKIVAPATADATLADIAITLAATLL